MILVFLVILVMALIIANIIVSGSRGAHSEERGFLSPEIAEAEEPEVITSPLKAEAPQDMENTAIIKGAITATNKKLNLINERVSILEKIVAELVERKIDTNSD